METEKAQLDYVIDRIRAIRNLKSLSQLELAGKAKLSTSFIASIESRKKQPTVMSLIKIANALEVSPRVFFPECANVTSRQQIRDEIVALAEMLV